MDQNPERRANVIAPIMSQLPKRRRAYRFTGSGGTKYKLKVYKSYGNLYWRLGFKTMHGMSVRIDFDRSNRPDSIKVNGFTWNWLRERQRNKYRWFPNADGLSNGLPDKAASMVNAALKEVQELVQQTVGAFEEECRQAERRAEEAAHQALLRRSSRNREHLQEVLEKV